MEIVTEGVEYAIDLFKEEYFDEKKFKKYINSSDMKIFIEHEVDLGRRTNKNILEQEIRKIFLDDKYEDPYEYNIVKKNILKIEEELFFIKKNKDEIFEKALLRVYRFIPKNVEIEPKVILYLGGIDGGFASFSKNVYINLSKYIGNLEEFKKVLSHEFYHVRKVPFLKKVGVFIRTSIYPERLMYDTIGRILEEGTACLIQHGLKFNVDDPVGNLTKRDLFLSKEHFELLNKSLETIAAGKPDYNLILRINIYLIGYIIIKTLYNNDGIDILNCWTLNYDYKIPIKRYIEICKESDISSGFSKEIENFLSEV